MHGTGDSSKFQLIESKVDKFYDNYEGYLSSHDWKRADDNQLMKIAAQIRSVSE